MRGTPRRHVSSSPRAKRLDWLKLCGSQSRVQSGEESDDGSHKRGHKWDLRVDNRSPLPGEGDGDNYEKQRVEILWIPSLTSFGSGGAPTLIFRGHSAIGPGGICAAMRLVAPICVSTSTGDGPPSRNSLRAVPSGMMIEEIRSGCRTTESRNRIELIPDEDRRS